MVIAPLLEVGVFGTHLTLNPAGTYSFSGTVPGKLRSACFETEDEGLNAFVSWFKGLDNDDKMKHGPNLRDDVFTLCWQS